VADVILSPYSLGREGAGLAAGPDAIAREAFGEVATDARVAPPASQFEVGRVFDVAREIAQRTTATGPALVLAGECSTAIGTVAGCGPRELGVVWLDAHADLNTPDTSPSGFVDGTALATVTGRCWHALCATVPGWAPIPDERVVLAGARDLDDAERDALSRSPLQVIDPAPDWLAELEAGLDRLRERVGRVYLHVDLDVLDGSRLPVNAWSCPGGPGAAELEAAVELVAQRFRVPAAALTALDPEVDATGEATVVAAGLARRLVDVVDAATG